MHATGSTSSSTPHEIELSKRFELEHSRRRRHRRLEELRQQEDEDVQQGRRELLAEDGGYEPFSQVDEGAMSYDEIYSEDVFLGRANRVSALLALGCCFDHDRVGHGGGAGGYSCDWSLQPYRPNY